MSIAETLCVGEPANGHDVLETIRASNGSATSVPEDEILSGMELVARYTDWKTGPVGAVVVAAAKRLLAQGTIRPDEQTVLVLTDSYSGQRTNGDYGNGAKGRIINLKPDYNMVVRTLESILAGQM